MHKVSRFLIGLVLVLLLMLIRAYASTLFYDPLIDFFKITRVTATLPSFDWPGLLLHVSLRFWMNSLISFAILWLIFRNRDLIRFSLILYGAFFLLFLLIFILLLKTFEPGQYMALFYIRRFLIHPLLLLVLIPGFYFFRNAK